MTFLEIAGLASFAVTALSFIGLAVCEQWIVWDTRHEPGLLSRMFVRGTKSAMYRALKGDWPELASAEWCRRCGRVAQWSVTCFLIVVLARVIDELVRSME